MKTLWPLLRRWGPYALAMAMVAWAVHWLVGHWDQVRAAVSVSPAYLAGLFPLILISTLAIGLTNQVVASHLGAVLTVRRWAALGFASTFTNYVMPRTGMALRGGYLKRRHNFPYGKFISTVLVVSVLALLQSATVGACLVGWFYWKTGALSWPLMGAFIAALALCLGLLFATPRTSGDENQPGFKGLLVRIHVGWDTLRRSARLLARVTGLCATITVLYGGRMHIAFAALGHDVPLAGCVLIGTLVSLSMFISITPAGLGIREAAIVFSSMALGVAPEISLLAGALDRAATMLFLLAVGPLSMAFIARDCATFEQAEKEEAEATGSAAQTGPGQA